MRAGLDEGDGGIVIDGIGVDIAHDANVVGDFLRPRKQVGIHLLTGFAKLAKLEDRACHGLGRLVGGHAGGSAVGLGREFLAVVFLEIGLVIEGLKLRGAAGLEEVDHPLGFRGEAGASKDAGMIGVGGFGHHGGESHASDAGGGLFEEVASIDRKRIVGNDRVHWTKLLAFPDGCVGVVSGLTDDGKSGGLNGVEILW